MSPHPNRLRAFTITEVVVALTISSLVAAVALPFLIFNLRSVFTGEQKLLINGDIRDITNAMMENAREANYFTLYESYNDQTVSGASVARDDNGDSLVNKDDRLASGRSGQFLCLVYTQTNALFDSRFYDGVLGNEPEVRTQVSRIVGYFVATNPTDSSKRALYMFDTDRSRGGGSTWTTPWGATLPVQLTDTTTLESLLPPTDYVNTSYCRVLINDLEGRATNGLLFNNFGNTTILVQARVLHGNRAKRVTNTYNFAITPRG